MLHLRITVESELTDQVLQLLGDDPAVSSLAVLKGASLQPVGDIVLADVAREGANEIIDQLEALDVARSGTVHVQPVPTWISEPGLEAEKHTPGSSADAVVWAEVTQRAYDESELNWGYLSFMTLATLLAGIAIVVDSQILVIGAMVLGPEFVAVAALGLALVRRRPALGFFAARTLVLGFLTAIAHHLPGRTGGPGARLDHGRGRRRGHARAPSSSTRPTSGPSSSRSSQRRPACCPSPPTRRAGSPESSSP